MYLLSIIKPVSMEHSFQRRFYRRRGVLFRAEKPFP